MEDRERETGRRRAPLPRPPWRSLERRRLALLAAAGICVGREGGRNRQARPAVRPPALVRLAFDRGGRERCRGRAPSGPLGDDDAFHLRPPLRRGRAWTALRRG